MTRTSTELPRLEPESSASTNSAMAAKVISKDKEFLVSRKGKNGITLDNKINIIYSPLCLFPIQNFYRLVQML